MDFTYLQAFPYFLVLSLISIVFFVSSLQPWKWRAEEEGVRRSLMQQLGGEFTLSQMEDGRTLSRVILPLAAQNER